MSCQLHMCDLEVRDASSAESAIPNTKDSEEEGEPPKEAPTESSRIMSGNRLCDPVDSEIGKVGLAICYDIRCVPSVLPLLLLSLLVLFYFIKIPRDASTAPPQRRSNSYISICIRPQDGSIICSLLGCCYRYRLANISGRCRRGKTTGTLCSKQLRFSTRYM